MGLSLPFTAPIASLAGFVSDEGVSLFFGSGVEQWGTLASALELIPFEPTARYSHGTSFRQLKRALGVRASGEPKYSHWLYGRRNDTEVLVLTYEVGSGSSRTTHTGVIARIDPPLLLGFGARARTFMDGLGPDGALLGDLAVDKQLYLSGFDHSRVKALLSIQEPDSRAIISQMLALAPLEVHVTDSLVLISKQGTNTDPHLVGPLIDRAVWLANAFAARRRTLAATPQELAMHAEWQSFAAAHGFRFDAARMKLEGAVDGSAVEMAIETEARISRTTVTVRFPSSVHVAFTARRTTMPNFLQGLFGQDIKIGDAAFDEMFVVTGRPEEAVREVLGKPELLTMLKEIGVRTTEVQLNHAQLHFSLESVITATPQLLWLAHAAQTTTTALFARAKTLGPYR